MTFWNGRKVLVTGGNGFIGSHLVELLVAEGAVVTTTASSEATRFRFLEAVKSEIRIVAGDLADPGCAQEAVRGQEIVIQLAARVGGIEYNLKHPGSIFYNNMSVFMSVLEAARRAGVELFLATSSACVYPRYCAIPTPEEEGFKDWPEPTNEGYGWAKRMEEFLGEAYAKEYGLKVRIARPYNAYGPRDNFDPASSHVIPALIRRIVQGENPMVVWGDGSASRSFLYVTDFARGLMAVAEKSPQVAAINIGANEETTIRELAETLVRISGKLVELQFDASKPTGQPRRCCDTRLAESLLGFQAQVPLEDGLRQTMEWYSRHLG
ncbi:MAG: NAD-dependent epimerase/dehydratase family protein [Chloroflexi bacterium]|nr:NAD-dependent epimerase/dehydratase family protein [Chloroflexota bacterium]